MVVKGGFVLLNEGGEPISLQAQMKILQNCEWTDILKQLQNSSNFDHYLFALCSPLVHLLLHQDMGVPPPYHHLLSAVVLAGW